MMSAAKKRIIAILLAASTFLTVLPHNIVFGNAESSSSQPSSAYIGATAELDDDDFALADNPSDFSGTHLLWNVKDDELPEKLIITDFYYDKTAENSEPMYEIDAAPGYTWPKKYNSYHWIEAKSVEILNKNGETYIYDNSGKKADKLELPRFNKRSLFAKSSLQGEVEYQWQICYNTAKSLWADIAGADTTQINVTYGLIASLLDENREVALRCKSTSGKLTSYSDEITVTSPIYTNDGSTVVATASVNKAAKATTARKASRAVSTYGAEDVKKTYNIVINYKYENGTVAYTPTEVGSFAEGTSCNITKEFPKIQGYLSYVNNVRRDSYTFNIASVTEDITIDVVYKPTDVAYKVVHYQQNVDNDGYTEKSRETKYGLTGTQVPELKETYEGFYDLLYERPNIAADGSTVIEIYYDRYYYLLNLDMDGGYGSEPVYARYGASISTVKDPTKTGYIFQGWSETKGGTTKADLPTKMPVYEGGTKTYYAIWKPVDTAKVTVVFWGENADDEKYSYLSDSTKEINLKPGKEFTYSEGEMMVCDKEVHTHTDACLECDKEVHTHSAVDGSCYTLTCTIENHTHGTGCYAGVGGEALSGSVGKPNNPSEGQVYNGRFGTYIYIKGTWYDYSGSTASGSVAPTTCGKQEINHTHNSDCYKLTCTTEEHTHEQKCYSCGKEQHTHNSDCYMQGAGLDSKKWKFVKSDTITVAADGSSVVNVYYDRVEYSVQFYENQSCSDNREYTSLKITAKWGQNILDKWPTYNNSSSWYVKDKSNTWQNSIQVMPVGGAKYWGPLTGSSSYQAHYYVEVLPGETGTTYNGVTYKLHHTDKSASSGNVTKEDKYGIQGFTYKEGTNDGTSYNNAKFYYTRNSYKLTFNDQYNDVRNESVKYEASLSTYKDYAPEVPSAFEPGSVEFGGWYQNPQCTGEEYKLEEHKMPANDLILYAKWVPVKHKVEFYLTESSTEVYNPDITTVENASFEVDHGDYIAEEYVEQHLDKAAMNEAKPNGDYTFVFWYYYEDGVKHPFDPTTSIRKDLTLYGEWSSNVLKEYTVQYVLKDNHSVKVADDTHGSGLAGKTKTFDAKGADELYTAYQEGYFPTVNSKSLLLDINEENLVITFEYVALDAVPYTVKYLEKDTEKPLADDKVVSDNRKAVVTETFKVISGYMPDAYQKRLVVTADGENVLCFYYTKDTEHAYYKVTHYIQNTDGVTWSEYKASQIIGNIGTRYTASSITISGFTYKETKYAVNGTEITDVTAEGARLTENGLEINLYYVRNEYPYQVRYLEQGTGKVLHDPKDAKAPYGQLITESAIDIDDYEKVAPTTAALQIRIEDVAELNVITFYYTEKSVEIKYVAVGSGSVNPASETVKITSTAKGSQATANDGYRLVGWFTDAACTTAVASSWVSDGKITPQKTNGKNVAATYYAKFEAANTSLTVKKSFPKNNDYPDDKQTFVFNIVGKAGTPTADINLTVTVQGEGEVTVGDLPIGDYTVTEQTKWSWRYEPVDGASKNITLSPTEKNEVEFVNERTEDKWLDGNAYCRNHFVKKAD